jgi:flagellar M-ring protein FliF
MDEVQDARVIMVAPEERLFGRDRREAKASVFVRLKPGRSLAPPQVEAIQFLVANSVEGMQNNRVAVVDSMGRALAEDQQANTVAAQANGQLGMVGRVEQNITDKAQSMLDQVLGPGQSVIRVSVDMDFDSVQETSERFDPKGAVVRSETASSETSSTTSESTGGSAGVTSNTASTEEKSSTTPQNSQQKRENTVNQYEINKVVETRQRAAGSIKRLSAAVFLNVRTSTPEGGGEASKTPRTPQDLKAIEDIVKEAVGFTQNGVRQDSIRIQEVEFSDWDSPLNTEPQTAPVMNNINHWLPYATQGALGLLALSVLFYLRSILKQSAQTGASAGAVFDDLIKDYEESTARNAQTTSNTRGVNVLNVEELGKLIRENPSNTAQAMKQWIARN